MPLRLLLRLPAVASILAVAAAAAPRESALKHDDACSPSWPGAGTCAVSALQQRSAQGGSGSLLAAARDQQDHQSVSSVEAVAAVDHPNGTAPPLVVASDDDWVWPDTRALEQCGGTPYLYDQYFDIYQMLSPFVNDCCPVYNAYFWPMLSFWSTENLRRAEALPDEPSADQRSQLQAFMRSSSYLACTWYMDPRTGSNFSAAVAEHWNKVRSMPDTSLEMPELPDFFSNMSGADRFRLVAADACMMWFNSMSCDLGYISRELRGSKDLDGRVCWDEVPLPSYGYDMWGINMMPGRAKLNSTTTDPMSHPEYLACQEKPLDEQEIMEYCPMGGHWRDGMWNSSWGKEPPVGSRRRDEVLKCNQKVGNPAFAGVTSMPFHVADEGGDIALVRPYQGFVIDQENMESSMDTALHTSRLDLEANIERVERTVVEPALTKLKGMVIKATAQAAAKAALAKIAGGR